MAPLPTIVPTSTEISSAGHTAVASSLSRTVSRGSFGTSLPHLPISSTYGSLAAATVASPVPTLRANITTSQSIASREGTWQASSADPARLSSRDEDELSDPDEDLQTRQTRRTRPPLSQKKGRVLAALAGGLGGAGAFGVIVLARSRIQAYNGAGAAGQSGDDSPETEGSNNAQDGEGLQDDRQSSELAPARSIPITGLTRPD